MQGGGNTTTACGSSIAASVAVTLQQMLPCSKLQHCIGSGRALQQLLPSASTSIMYWWGFCSRYCQQQVIA